MSTSTPYQDRGRHRHVGGQGRSRRVDRLRPRGGFQRERTRWIVSSWVPQGQGLPDEDWNTRHRVLLWVLALHPPALVAYTYATGSGAVHGLVMVVPVVLLLGGTLAAGRRRARAWALSLGLLVSSAILVHLARGAIEAHFHYFLVLALVALYEDWTVYLLAVVFVWAEHGLIGQLVPGSVYDHPGHPWLLAGVHAGSVLAVAIAQAVFWHFNEQSRRRSTTTGSSSTRASRA